MWQHQFHHQRQGADKGKTRWSTAALPIRRETNKIDLVNNNNNSGASGWDDDGDDAR
jgi:hypothetical protein